MRYDSDEHTTKLKQIFIKKKKKYTQFGTQSFTHENQ